MKLDIPFFSNCDCDSVTKNMLTIHLIFFLYKAFDNSHGRGKHSQRNGKYKTNGLYPGDRRNCLNRASIS